MDGNSYELSLIRDALNERYDVALHLTIFDFQEASDKRVIFNRVRELVQKLDSGRIRRELYLVALRRTFEEIFGLYLEGLGEVVQPACGEPGCSALVFLDLARTSLTPTASPSALELMASMRRRIRMRLPTYASIGFARLLRPTVVCSAAVQLYYIKHWW